MTRKITIAFTNEEKHSGKVLSQDKGYSANKCWRNSWQAMVTFSTGPTAADDWRGFFPLPFPSEWGRREGAKREEGLAQDVKF